MYKGKHPCYDCGRLIDGPSGCSVMIPGNIWLKISPTKTWDGILCFCCIAERCAKAGLKNVPFVVVSGPMKQIVPPENLFDFVNS